MQKVKDFEDSPNGLENPVKCDCGKWMESADAHPMGEKRLCRECDKEFQDMLKRAKGIKLPKDVKVPKALKNKIIE